MDAMIYPELYKEKGTFPPIIAQGGVVVGGVGFYRSDLENAALKKNSPKALGMKKPFSFVNSKVFDEKNGPKVWVYIGINSLKSLSVNLLKSIVCNFLRFTS